jgi:hypothetical protein
MRLLVRRRAVRSGSGRTRNSLHFRQNWRGRGLLQRLRDGTKVISIETMCCIIPTYKRAERLACYWNVSNLRSPGVGRSTYPI